MFSQAVRSSTKNVVSALRLDFFSLCLVSIEHICALVACTMQPTNHPLLKTPSFTLKNSAIIGSVILGKRCNNDIALESDINVLASYGSLTHFCELLFYSEHVVSARVLHQDLAISRLQDCSNWGLD